MENNNPKKICTFGVNKGLAYEIGAECGEGEVFLPDFCDCQLYAKAECSCSDDCPSGGQCVDGKCVSSYWIFEGRVYDGYIYTDLDETDWQSGGSFTPIQLLEGNQAPTVYVYNQIGTASPQLADATPFNSIGEGDLDGGSCTGDAIVFYFARIDENYPVGDASYVRQIQTAGAVPCSGSYDPYGNIQGEWYQSDADGNKL